VCGNKLLPKHPAFSPHADRNAFSRRFLACQLYIEGTSDQLNRVGWVESARRLLKRSVLDIDEVPIYLTDLMVIACRLALSTQLK
jgi:hypothetical protein